MTADEARPERHDQTNSTCAMCAGKDLSSQPSRELMLSRLIVGDVFNAASTRSDAALTCIVTSFDETIIHARRLLVATTHAFNRKTGVSLVGDDAVINSIEPLPVDVYNQMFYLDRKNRLGWDISKGRLSSEEIQALLFLSEHYERNQLPPLEAN